MSWWRRLTSLPSSSEKGNYHIFLVFFCDLLWLSKTIIVLDRQGEPILVQNLFNVAILNVLWVIVASHRCYHIVVRGVISDQIVVTHRWHHMSSFIIFDDNPSGMTCPTPKLNTLFASSQNPFRLKWDSFLIPQSCLPHLKISLRWRIWESYLRSRGRDISSQDGQGGTNRNRCHMLKLYLRVRIYCRKEYKNGNGYLIRV